MLMGARMRQLRSGHSHEDIDQLFGRLASYIARRVEELRESADPFWRLAPHANDVILRTKHNMADSRYTYNLVYYPCAVARVRLPLGLPAGLAPKNLLPADFKKDVLNKYYPVIREYGMIEAAEYLKDWVSGTLPLEPLGSNESKEARDQVTHYVASARKRLALKSAAEAWALGIPWAESIKICQRAFRQANPKPKALPKGAPKRRATRG
ncbi:FO synthase subunit 1 [Durusdinium trenchii]|uniref:FO synthase subunit 1 n=1 Tax=Durusdinium trenchii TaxID=1381693 RepID=A0ABP0S101_9DINO